jgi:hypothetical protein
LTYYDGCETSRERKNNLLSLAAKTKVLWQFWVIYLQVTNIQFEIQKDDRRGTIAVTPINNKQIQS